MDPAATAPTATRRRRRLLTDPGVPFTSQVFHDADELVELGQGVVLVEGR
jgi:hypothetical protein